MKFKIEKENKVVRFITLSLTGSCFFSIPKYLAAWDAYGDSRRYYNNREEVKEFAKDIEGNDFNWSYQLKKRNAFLGDILEEIIPYPCVNVRLLQQGKIKRVGNREVAYFSVEESNV